MFQTIPSRPVLALVMPAVSCMGRATPLTEISLAAAAFNHECAAAGTAQGLDGSAISRQRKRGPRGPAPAPAGSAKCPENGASQPRYFRLKITHKTSSGDPS